MDATTLENQFVALRAGDGLLEQRLAELDAKLGAWLALIQAGRAALLELARTVGSSGISPGTTIWPAPVQAVELGGVHTPLTTPPNNEESLFQTLDHETANAIRVKRRLCRGTRNVRELLDEYRAAQAQASAQKQDNPSKRRGWWRRQDG